MTEELSPLQGLGHQVCIMIGHCRCHWQVLCYDLTKRLTQMQVLGAVHMPSH